MYINSDMQNFVEIDCEITPSKRVTNIKGEC